MIISQMVKQSEVTLMLSRKTARVHVNKGTHSSISALGRATAFKDMGSLTATPSLLAKGKWHTSEGIYNIEVNVIKSQECH